jgi:hypothetical protein
MNLNAHQNAFLLDFAKLIVFVDNHDDGMLITEGEGWRPQEMQQIYFDRGMSNTLTSNHGRRLAHDLNFIKGGTLITDKASLKVYGDYWESLSPENRWGGNFKSFKSGDTGHFERNI